jgi:sigma-B regulation protein RsbU (phosphoserine phosphatase)
MEKALKEYINNLRITTTAKEKMENELNIAREIQMGIIPHVFPAFPNKKEFDLFAILEPAKTVGGDLYDYFLLDSNHLCFAIGDVSGKSIPAALYMSGTKTLLRAKANKKTPICKIVQGMNDILCEDSNASMFVTFFLGILDLLTGELEYFSAGHNPPYLSRYEKNIEILENIHSPALGILKQNLTLSSKIILEPHDEIILFTDGVTEAMNSTFELYSEKRLESELKNFKTNTPEETANNILKSVRNFAKDAEQFDDITILVIRYFGNNK